MRPCFLIDESGGTIGVIHEPGATHPDVERRHAWWV
jgi:hypothetical protein